MPEQVSRVEPAEAQRLQSQDLPLLPVRDTVLFPHAVLPLTVGRESSVQLINSLGEEKQIIVVAQREARVDNPSPAELFQIGTLAVVHKVVKMPNQSLFVFAEGLDRVHLKEFPQLTPFMRAVYEVMPEGPEIETENLREAAHWLEMHAADVPAPWLAYVQFRSVYANGGNAREELTAFAQWFEEYLANAWDRRIEADILAGRLDEAGRRADQDFEAGRCKSKDSSR